MPSGRRFRTTPEADADIVDLLRYSLTEWGSEQRDRYRRLLEDAFDHLSSFPHAGKPLAHMPGARTWPVGQHVVVYASDDESVTVLRVLHRRMAVERHLP